MMRDITIGQYYPVDSVIHALDPRTKLLGALIYIISLFYVRKIIWFAVCLLVILVLYRIAKVPFVFFLKGLKKVIILLIFTFIFRMMITPGHVIWSFWVIDFTQEGVIKGIKLASRIALMITGSSLLSYTTTPRELADGLERSLSFLERFHIPIKDMAVITMIVFRFIPMMLEEANLIMDAQAARGVEFEQTNIFRRTKNTFSVAMPLFISSFRRSADLAMAMEARGFTGTGKQTKMNPLQYSKHDYAAYVIIAVYLAVSIVVAVI